MQNVGSTANINGNNYANGSSNRRDEKAEKQGGRGSYKSASPAPDKLLRKEGKFVSIFFFLLTDKFIESVIISN